MNTELLQKGWLMNNSGAYLQQGINVLLTIAKYTFLFILLFLLASHENANPKLGSTNFEFYSAEFRKLMLQPANKYTRDEQNTLTSFYSARQYMPAWTTNFEIKSTFTELMELLRNSYNYGLLPSAYEFQTLEQLSKQLSLSSTDDRKMSIRVQLEMKATLSALKYMNHIAYGIREDDTTAAYRLKLSQLPGYLNKIMASNHLREGILDLQPESRQYIRLQRAAARFFNKAKADTAQYNSLMLQENPELIVKRLIMQGYLDESFINDSVAIQSAIRKFQKTHCLEMTGVADKSTIELLALGVKDNFYKIALNLDRLRKDALKNDQYILVNLPEFKLHYYSERGICKDFNVIVGKEETPTPIISSNIDFIIANPYWTVPQSISRNEILPLIKKDSMYMAKHKFTVVDDRSKPVDIAGIDWSTVNPDDFNYWFKQDNQNSSLGAIKFQFPNEHAVYLHDTPAKKLFEKRNRTFSHGCVRVQNPEVLAQLILADYSQDENKTDIMELIEKKKYREIKIEKSLPIYIRYYSCTADSTGDIYYHPDIYKLDQTASTLLFGNLTWE